MNKQVLLLATIEVWLVVASQKQQTSPQLPKYGQIWLFKFLNTANKNFNNRPKPL